MDSQVLSASKSSVLGFLSPRIFSQQLQDMYNGLIDYERFLVMQMADKLPKYSWTDEQWVEWTLTHISSTTHQTTQHTTQHTPSSISTHAQSYRAQVLQQVSAYWQEYVYACREEVRRLCDGVQQHIPLHKTSKQMTDSLGSGADDGTSMKCAAKHEVSLFTYINTYVQILLRSNYITCCECRAMYPCLISSPYTSPITGHVVLQTYLACYLTHYVHTRTLHMHHRHLHHHHPIRIHILIHMNIHVLTQRLIWPPSACICHVYGAIYQREW
ncbi:hypothetical protein EON65_18760 [archaeon]|nr:MAG: hypothetical protein EON65_18760 [archaeon]